MTAPGTFGYPHHLDLTVSDMEASIAFYETVLTRLGYRRSTQYAGEAPCWLYAPQGAAAFSIALHQAGKRTAHDRYAPGMHHLAFHARNRADVDGFFDYLVERGVTILDPPAEYDYTPGYYAVFFADPDGIKLELVYEPNPDTFVG